MLGHAARIARRAARLKRGAPNKKGAAQPPPLVAGTGSQELCRAKQLREPLWILLLLFGVPSWFMVYVWAHTNMELTGRVVAVVTAFVALMRVIIWCCFRFPLTEWFFVIFIAFLVMGGLRWL